MRKHNYLRYRRILELLKSILILILLCLIILLKTQALLK